MPRLRFWKQYLFGRKFVKSSNRVAIVGAGLCGMATAFYLLPSTHNITLIDQQLPGAGLHRIDAGMMHPFAGMRARKAPNFDSCRALTLELFTNRTEPQLVPPLQRMRPFSNRQY